MKKLTSFKMFLRKVISIIKLPEMRILPGQLAFFIVVSIIPMVTLVGAIGSGFGLPTASIKDIMGAIVPSNILNYFVQSTTSSGILSFNVTVFFIAAFILASNGTHSIIITSNQIYKIENDHELRRRGKAIVMAMILVSLLLFLILVPAFGDVFIRVIETMIENERIVNIIEGIYHVAKYPISIFLLYYNLKLLYMIAPDKKIDSKSVVPGAMFTTIMWLVSSRIYVFYVDYFANYSVFYGAMSNILVLLIWVYILAYIFTLGLCFNSTGVIQETLILNRDEIMKRKKKNKND